MHEATITRVIQVAPIVEFRGMLTIAVTTSVGAVQSGDLLVLDGLYWTIAEVCRGKTVDVLLLREPEDEEDVGEKQQAEGGERSNDPLEEFTP